MSEKTKDVLIRSIRTFWEAALAAIIVSLPEIVDLIPSGWAAIKPVFISVGVGALAAGITAAYNGVLKPYLDKSKTKEA